MNILITNEKEAFELIRAANEHQQPERDNRVQEAIKITDGLE